jgi:phosphoribosyl 1,2-cyclic phosphodiesterase
VSAPDKYEVEHLNLEDTKILIKEIKPKVAILTHFGMSMIKAKPWEVAASLEKELKTKVVAASDGMTIDLDGVL